MTKLENQRDEKSTGGRHAPKRLRTRERRARAWAMRMEHDATFQEIADTLGVTVGTAHKDVAAVVAQAAAGLEDRATESLIADLDELDRMQRGLTDDARGGDVAAVGGVLKCMERRARLLGYEQRSASMAVASLQFNQHAPVDMESFMQRIEDAIPGVLEVALEGSESSAEIDPAKNQQ